MSIADYFYNQFAWYVSNISLHNFIMCGYLIAGGFLLYSLLSVLVNIIARKQDAGGKDIDSRERTGKPDGKGKKQSVGEIIYRGLGLGLLTAYLYLVFHFTVFVRSAYSEPHYTLELFWSYKLAMQGSKGLLVEIILNCIMLIPEGFLLPVVLPTRKRSVKFWLTALFGFLTTCTVELLQLTLMRGLFEFDDIINNFIGIIAGYLIYFVISVIIRGVRGRKKGKNSRHE